MTDTFAQALSAVRRKRLPGSPLAVGSVVGPLGLVLIGLAWLGASRTPVLTEQVAYLISGGILGLALVGVGCFLYFSHWQTEQLHATHAQTAQVTEALADMRAALELVAATLGAQGRMVATREGTMSHLPSCSVVRGREGLVAADPALAPCKICQPT